MDNPEVKNKVDKYDLDTAISDLSNMVGDSADMLLKLKKVKFMYLKKTLELYTRMDCPSMMMDSLDKQSKEMVPSYKNINNLDF